MTPATEVRSVLICVNGILTKPGAADNWTGRAVTWAHLHTSLKAEKVEYYTGPLTRVFGQRMRARKLATTLRYYEGWNIILVGHSNGCDVILDALAAEGWPEIRGLHLISGACEADCEKNGINAAGWRLGRVVCYVAEKDWALRLADTFTGRLLGYGALGRTGPVHAGSNVEVVREPIGHGDWFRQERFDRTMDRLTRGAN